ncbi:hypothetical protein COOONC_25762 [Cooperia oncophora]
MDVYIGRSPVELAEKPLEMRMMLSTLTPRLVSRQCMNRIIAIRSASKGMQLSGKQSLTVDPALGHFKYERDISRDPRYTNPQKLGDTPTRYVLTWCRCF